jgi:hypothetical protein
MGVKFRCQFMFGCQIPVTVVNWTLKLKSYCVLAIWSQSFRTHNFRRNAMLCVIKLLLFTVPLGVSCLGYKCDLEMITALLTLT